LRMASPEWNDTVTIPMLDSGLGLLTLTMLANPNPVTTAPPLRRIS
jgi:hypothetical protein